MNFETHVGGEIAVTPVNPKPVVDVTSATRHESYSTTINLIAGAAGFTGIVALPAPILSLYGEKVGSHWRRNPVWGVKTKVETVTVTETATAAAFTVYDSVNNLENLFEGVANVGRYIARITIDGGSELYGWIGGVTVASNVYTFTVFNGAALGTQSWVGTLPAGRNVRKLEIFRNMSSIAFTTGTVLTREIPWDFAVTEQQNVMDLLATMSNGDFAVDYARAEVHYKKATSATTDTITYETYSGTGALATDVEVQPYGTFTSGSKVVAVAGAAEALAASTACKRVDVQAYIVNAGNVAIGSSGVDASATLSTGTGMILEPGDSYTLFVENLAEAFVDVLNNGDGVRFNYYV